MAEYIERGSIKYEQWSVGPLNAPLMVVRKKTIDSIPAADVAPVVHGRWIDAYKYVSSCKCTVCGAVYATETRYCPNCGARMDGE